MAYFKIFIVFCFSQFIILNAGAQTINDYPQDKKTIEDVPERMIHSGLTGKIKLTKMLAHRKLKFLPAVNINRKLKASSIERIYQSD